LKPPTADLRNWRDGVSAADIRCTEVMLRSTLADFGYPVSPRGPVLEDGWYWLRGRFTVAAAVPKNLTPIRRHLVRQAGELVRRVKGGARA